MLIVTAKLSRKKLILCITMLIALILGLILLFSGSQKAEEPPSSPFENIATNEARLALLAECGCEALPEPVTTLDLQLPSPLDERYAAYNQLQIPQGFDLVPYCGKQLTRYTYTITNHASSSQGVQANLYFCENTLVAADPFCAGENGFIAPLFAK